MRKLNMWQRLGIVASVLWIMGGGLWQRVDDTNRAQAFMNMTYQQCSDESASRNDYNFKPCMDKAWGTYKVFIKGSWGNVAFFAFAPMLLGWLTAWICVWVGRWVLAGRKAQ